MSMAQMITTTIFAAMCVVCTVILAKDIKALTEEMSK